MSRSRRHRLPRARPPWRRRRNGLSVGRGTAALGVLAATGTAATIGVEYARVWRRGSAPLPHETDHLVAAGATATRETLAVLREGYRVSPNRENVMFNMLGAFTVTLAAARGTTLVIRRGRASRLFRNVVVGDRHIHHFVPGFLLTFAAGGISIAFPREHLDRWLAIPFGAGVALVLDEAALLLQLEDVYWTEEGVLSLQLSFATGALLAATALGVRLLRRGEPYVIHEAPSQSSPQP